MDGMSRCAYSDRNYHEIHNMTYSLTITIPDAHVFLENMYLTHDYVFKTCISQGIKKTTNDIVSRSL